MTWLRPVALVVVLVALFLAVAVALAPAAGETPLLTPATAGPAVPAHIEEAP